MNYQKAISIRFNPEEFQRLEQAALLAGYTKLSPFIRDCIFGKIDAKNLNQDNLETWTDKQEILGQLSELSRVQAESQALLSAIFYLSHKKATVSEMSELRAAIQVGARAFSPLDKIAPELGQLIKQLQPE